MGGTAKTKYVESPVYDTLTINLPDLEDEFCKIRIYGNNAELTGSDYVRYGKVKFYVGSIPGGVLAGVFGRRIGVLWLHRALGLVILWGGVRYLW